MNGRDKLVIIKNAFANVARGGANALVAIALPPALTRTMSTEAYGAWALVLQLGAYVGYFDFGLQTAVARFVAHCTERGEHRHRKQIVSTSTAALTLTGLLSFAALALFAFFLPQIFTRMSPSLQPSARTALLIVSASLAVGLPASVYHGIFVGLQRNEISAFIIGGSRLLGAVLLALAAWHQAGLIGMALVLASVNLGSYMLAWLTARRVAPEIRFEPASVKMAAGRDLFTYCYSLSVWSVAMLLVTGLDLTIVGICQYSAVAFYAIAAGVVTLFAGLQNAVFSALMPAAAVLHARGDSRALGHMFVRASRYGAFLLIITGFPLMLFATPILRLWVGNVYAMQGAHYLIVLVLANIIRLFMTPYAVTLIATGQQQLIILSPIAEGLTNLLASVGLGYAFGAIGVAYGTLIGAVVGVLLNVYYNMPRTLEIRFQKAEYLNDALVRPITSILPILACIGALHLWHLGVLGYTLSLTIATAVSLALFWSYGLLLDEKAKFFSARHILLVPPIRERVEQCVPAREKAQ